jgi:hypothetical protein
MLAERAVMEVEESELEGFIDASLRDTTLLIGEFGINITPAGTYDKGSVRYQKVSNALGRLECVEHTLGIKNRWKWENTELPSNRRNGAYLTEKLRAIKKQLEQIAEGYPPAS